MYHNSDSRHGLNGDGRHLLKLISQGGGVWLFRPKTTRNGIVLYGKVVSFNDGRKTYNVKKERLGTYRFDYKCTCLGSFLGHYLCQHIARFKLVEATTGERR